MKRIIHIFLIISLAFVTVMLMDKMIISNYSIPDNIVETDIFRKLDINSKCMVNAFSLSKEKNIDFSRLLACNYIYNNCRLENIKLNYNKYKEQNSNYKLVSQTEYSKICKAMSAIFDDLKYFPVAKGSVSDTWVNYEDSFGADRNYNGAYKHEGTDLMAQNNISGYYPIVSVTDGIVENIGWLEKGGYRIGVRSPSGGYFYYAHMSSYADVKKGDKIKAGTLLGYMGDTGYGKEEGTSGNFDVHLHFGIYIKTENYEELSVNPYNILKFLENKLIIANY